MSSPRIVAHRGLHGVGAARENTLAAIRAAVDGGADVVEVDVRLTSDGAVALLHDETFDRLWGDPRRVSETTLVEVRELGGGERRVPLLAEAIEAIRGTGVPLLIDMDHAGVAAPAARVVERSRAEDIVEWCGAHAAMRVIREALPDAVIHQPWSAAAPPVAEDLAELRPAFVNVPHLLVGEAFVEAVHALGPRVACWTVDEGAQAAHLAEIGVDSVTTNHPERVRDAVPDETARRLAIVEQLAVDAAEAARRARCDGVGMVETKRDPADHVTEVDRAIEGWVRAVLGAQFPEHDIVGEEFGGETDGVAPCWYLDPVDGTANLANGMPWTSFSLALVERGDPIVGAIVDPAGGAPVVAARGRGARRAGERIAVGPASGDPLVGRMVATELAGAVPWPGFASLLEQLADRHCTLRVLGSGTAALAGPALGRGVAALVHRYSPIDHAASLVIVREAGGVARVLPSGVALTAASEESAAAVEGLLA
ncbi:inositol monophosphatase family protein [Microbacterium karelineae]|uniref:inositol monophosphatase family protein n=1 Tax=Microbacterium karelineae TaxID=2654283 RepID=UPI0012EAC933|nr:inositol monophosphatase family protein [Microbacterium karelineae]